MNIKTNDKVIVITGKDKGTETTVSSVLKSEGKVILEGVNLSKKHAKSKQQGKKGEIIDKAMPIDVSNVALIDPKDGKATRIAFKTVDGKKVRVAARSGEVIK